MAFKITPIAYKRPMCFCWGSYWQWLLVEMTEQHCKGKHPRIEGSGMVVSTVYGRNVSVWNTFLEARLCSIPGLTPQLLCVMPVSYRPHPHPANPTRYPRGFRQPMINPKSNGRTMGRNLRYHHAEVIWKTSTSAQMAAKAKPTEDKAWDQIVPPQHHQ